MSHVGVSAVGATQEASSTGTERGEHAKPALDGLPFRDQSRFQSSEITRAFASTIRATSEGQQSEVSEPDEVSLEPDAAISEVEIVRGVD